MMPDATTPDYRETLDYLRGLKTAGIRLGLERMRRLTEALGHPENRTPCVNVAGTNGKGSVAAMLDAIGRAAGWRTGLYTSPHLVKLGERVQVNRQILTEGEIVALTREMRPVVERLGASENAGERPSYFEFMTAMAFLQFARCRCDFAVIETGLGGRDDATNVVTPEVSVITSIGLDHCELLGDSIEAIAQQKAGIIKRGVPVVIGRLPPPAEGVVRAVAAQQGSQVFSVAEEFGDDLERYPDTNLDGDYQCVNAATATLAARALSPRRQIREDVIAAALVQVDWPGRWQRLRVGGRSLILDASHNAEGAHALDRNLARLTRETGGAPIVIAGVLGAARARPLIETICRHAKEIHFVVPRQSRACSHDQLEALVPAWFHGNVVRAAVENLFFPNLCTAGAGNEAVVVTGSIYLLGEVMVRLDPNRGPLEDTLQDF